MKVLIKKLKWIQRVVVTIIRTLGLFFTVLCPTLVGMKKVSLGPLEQEIMNSVWKNKSSTARDIFQDLSKNKKIAYNTIQTIMTRLVDKGVLERKLEGKTHIYTSKDKKKNVIQKIVNQSMNSFVSQFGDEALLAFVDGIDKLSEETRKKMIDSLQKK